VADGGKAIEQRWAADEHRRLFHCLCHLIRSIGAGTVETVLVRPVLWSCTHAEMEIEQRRALLGLRWAGGKASSPSSTTSG
jgi:hypothetical protein